MAILTKEELINKFQTGDKPTQQDFQDLLDSLVDQTQVSGVQTTWQPPNSPVYMSQGQELTITHPSITNETYSISVSQEVPGATGKTNVSIDFAPGADGNYIQEDNSTEFVGGVVKLEAGLIANVASYPAITGTHNSLSTSGGGILSTIFDGNTATRCDISGSRNITAWVKWGYATAKRVGKFVLATANQRDYNLMSTFYISGSNDGTNFITIETFPTPTSNGATDLLTYNINPANQSLYSYYRLNFPMMNNSNAEYCYINDLQIYENAAYPVDQGYYVTTSDNSHFALAQASKIESIVITNTQPANTSIMCLASFDGRQTWNSFNGTAWVSATLANITTEGCSVTQLQNGFINMATDGKSFIDLAFDLKTADVAVTPSVDLVTITYQENSHYEMATIGNYTSSSDFGLKRVDPTTTIIKRINAVPGKAFITMSI